MIIAWILVWTISGAVVVSGAVLGLAWYISKAADHAPHCQCRDCQKARMRKPHPWKAVEDGTVIPVPNEPRPGGKWWTDEKRNIPPPRGEWKSTLELREGMFVVGKAVGSVYRVMEVNPVSIGFEVRLRNQLSGEFSVRTVYGDRAQVRQWLVRPSRKRG